MKRFLLLAVFCILISARGEFAIRDGDTVVFLGDSITAARQYSKIIENYTLLRFPERRVKFINAGRGGETAKGSLERLQRDVLDQGATLVTVAYGVNDIGWGTRADEAHKQEYLNAISELIDRCQKRGVRVYICSAAITAENPDTAEKGFLQRMCDEGLQLAKSKNAGAIDVQRTMREVQRRMEASNARQSDKSKPARMHVEDGVHLNELGQFAMGYAILKGLGAPADVSSAVIDAKAGKATSATDCKITDISSTPDFHFVRTDSRLPLNLQPLWMLFGFYIPIGDELNRYLLTIQNLPDGKYEIRAGGRPLGKWSNGELNRGINIATASADPWVPGGPWDAQAQSLKVLTDMRDEIYFAQRGMESTLQSHPNSKTLRREAAALERSISKLQHDLAHPIPIRFEVKKINP